MKRTTAILVFGALLTLELMREWKVLKLLGFDSGAFMRWIKG